MSRFTYLARLIVKHLTVFQVDFPATMATPIYEISFFIITVQQTQHETQKFLHGDPPPGPVDPIEASNTKLIMTQRLLI